MNHRVRAVIRKEFREYRRNKLIVMTAALLPLIFLVMSLVTVIAVPEEAPAAMVPAVVGQAMMLFLLVPVLLPSTIAAHTVIGERDQRTLEPVLTTPVTDVELLVGKAVAATVPSVVLGWALFAAYVLLATALAAPAVVAELATLPWAVAQVTLNPALAVLAVEIGMLISARSTDVRVAQQVVGLAMLPVVGAIALFSFGVIAPTAPGFLLATALTVAVDVVAWRFVTRMFDRERVLTRFG